MRCMGDTMSKEINLAKAIGQAPKANSDKHWVSSLGRGRLPGPRMENQVTCAADVSIGTKCVHAGTYEDPVTGMVGTPIFQATTFAFRDETYDSFADGTTRDVPIYTRYGNPSQWSVQEKISTLETAESSLVFSSGMAAITTSIIALTNRGGHIITSYDVYGGTYNFVREDIHQMGREVSFVDSTNIESIRDNIRENTQMFFFESLSNPLLKAIPLAEIVKIAREKNILVVIDNTFLSPIHSRPHLFGVDIVIHSCTKYMNGHSDVTAGVASGRRKYIDRIWAQMLKLGGSLDPMGCFLLERGLKTLELRMARHSENSEALANALQCNHKIEKVYHPSLDDYPYQWINGYCDKKYGGVVSFEVKGGDEAALELLKHVRIPKAATSLGGVESLISLPFNTSHSSLTKAQRKAVGINPGLVRYSAGIEDKNDLINDLYEALENI